MRPFSDPLVLPLSQGPPHRWRCARGGNVRGGTKQNDQQHERWGVVGTRSTEEEFGQHLEAKGKGKGVPVLDILMRENLKRVTS